MFLTAYPLQVQTILRASEVVTLRYSSVRKILRGIALRDVVVHDLHEFFNGHRPDPGLQVFFGRNFLNLSLSLGLDSANVGAIVRLLGLVGPLELSLLVARRASRSRVRLTSTLTGVSRGRAVPLDVTDASAIEALARIRALGDSINIHRLIEPSGPAT